MPKKHIGIFFFIFFTIFFFLEIEQSRSEQFQPAVVGILDIQRIKKESKAIVNIRNQIREIRKNYETDFRSQEDILRQEEQELARQRAVLSKEAFTKKDQEFRKKIQTLQQNMQQASQKLQQAEAAALRVFNDNLRPIVIAVSKKNRVNVVLFASQVAYAPRGLDLTVEIMKRLDEVLPEVAVTISE